MTLELFARLVGPAMLSVSAWLIREKYRSIQHRHDGSYRAVDEVSKAEWNAADIVTLAEMLDPPTMSQERKSKSRL